MKTLTIFIISLCLVACSLTSTTNEPTAVPLQVQSQPVAPTNTNTPLPSPTVSLQPSNTPQPVAQEPPCNPRADWHNTYTIVPGDTVTNIAARYGITNATLVVANCIDNPNTVQVGQVLRVPTNINNNDNTTNNTPANDDESEDESSNPPQTTQLTVSPATAAQGDTITITWNVAGEFAEIDLWVGYEETSELVVNKASASGTVSYEIDQNHYYDLPVSLYIKPAPDIDTRDIVEEVVTITCPRGEPFFGDDPLVEVDCPRTEVLEVWMQYQSFEQGFVIWGTPQNNFANFESRDVAIVFYENTGTYSVIRLEPLETFDEEPPGSLSPPDLSIAGWWMRSESDASDANPFTLGWAQAPPQQLMTRVQSIARHPSSAGGTGEWLYIVNGSSELIGMQLGSQSEWHVVKPLCPVGNCS